MDNQKFIPLKIMNERERKEILDKLNEQFGINEIPGKIVARGKDRLFLSSVGLSDTELKNIEDSIVIERVGVYFAKVDDLTGKIRLSIEGSQIFKNQIKKNIFEIQNNEDFEKWMKGQELNISTGKKDFLIMKYKDNFVGTGKASAEKISNFIPKNRRLKERG
ncbi:hypothetical protein J4407_03085 [Candidatus Pacearchaeota archaeon]|nr:hypothetical protein [Candidatus Pacearchaeota archaeon]